MNFYFQSADVLDRLDFKRGSIKSLLATLPETNRKRTTALVIETLKYKPILSEVITAAQLLKHEKKITSKNLALVLVHDALLAPGGIQAGSGPLKQAVLRHKTRLSSELQRIKVRRGVKSNVALATANELGIATRPRYARINTHKWSIQDAIDSFVDQGFQIGDVNLDLRYFSQDEHIPDLLHFPKHTVFHNNPAYISGRLILQDKASCFPAIVLAPPVSDDAAVIDATAAPGNKTSHLSALMRGKGTLFAFERDKRRFGTLKTMLARAGCDTHVHAFQADFLGVDPTDVRFACVTHILLDPSCSGSGIVNRLDYLLEPEVDSDEESASNGRVSSGAEDTRLAKLSCFQLRIIQHAMKFPAVVKIVYSTCSIHPAENEQVVRDALRSMEAIAAGFVLAPRADVLPAWPRRGVLNILDDEGTESVIRCSPKEDATNGFFVACFVRRGAEMMSITSGKRRLSGNTGSNTGDRTGMFMVKSNQYIAERCQPSTKKKSRKRSKSALNTLMNTGA